MIAGVWGFIRGTFAAIGGFFTSAAARIGEAILKLPIIATLRQLFAIVRDFFAGDTTFLEAGKRLIMTLGDGILSMATYPYRKVKEVLGKIRNLLPFSDAQEGPLATRLIPKALSAVLLLTPVLAASAPVPHEVSRNAGPLTPSEALQRVPAWTAPQKPAVAAPVEPFHAGIVPMAHPVPPALTPPEIAVGWRPLLPAPPSLSIPGTIIASPPSIPSVDIHSSLRVPALQDEEAVAPPVPVAMVMPSAERLARFQQPRRPAESLAATNTSPASRGRSPSSLSCLACCRNAPRSKLCSRNTWGLPSTPRRCASISSNSVGRVWLGITFLLAWRKRSVHPRGLRREAG